LGLNEHAVEARVAFCKNIKKQKGHYFNSVRGCRIFLKLKSLFFNVAGALLDHFFLMLS
jgi:hypothetical protein